MSVSRRRWLLLMFLFITGPSLAASVMGGDLPRQADLGFRAVPDAGAVRVAHLVEGSPAADQGLRNDDLIVAIDGHSFARGYQGAALLERLRADQPIEVTVQRGQDREQIRFRAPGRALEAIPGVTTHYGAVDLGQGVRLRTLISLAEGHSGPLKPILFTQWVSCGSIEYREGSVSSHVFAALARDSGRALVRVERSTSGDSEGPACHELDYNSEVDHYVRAFTALLESPLFSNEQVVVWGSSLGSTTAPLVAAALQQQGVDIAGVAVQGGGGLTHLERMIQFDRQYLERRLAVDPADYQPQMYDRIRFHYEYLVRGRQPEDIANDDEAMATIVTDIRGLGDGVHYGRPYAWHQQAAGNNFMAAWSQLMVPTLVVFNEYDQFEGRYGARLITDTLNRREPGLATYIEQTSIGHSNYAYPSADAAYANQHGVAVPNLLGQRLLAWLATLED